MRIEDIPQIGTLYFRIFRNKMIFSSSDFNSYFENLFFGSPFYDPAHGGFVHEAADGRIDSVMSAVPMQYYVNGRIMVARLLGTFMTDPDIPTAGAAQLTLHMLRARNQDLCFTDSAAPVSARHFRAVGGLILPAESLEWCCVFKRAGYAISRLTPRTSVLRETVLLPFSRIGDALIDRIRKPLSHEASPGVRDEAMDVDAFQEQACAFLENYSVRPIWSKPELTWILHMASMYRSDGPLQMRCVYDASGRPCGCYVFFGKPGSTAKVLNILTASPKDDDLVVGQMLHHLDAAGHIAARGPVQPRFLEAFSKHQALFYRHKAYTCVSSRHHEVNEAVSRHDIFLGGLAGEAWSRIALDFH